MTYNPPFPAIGDVRIEIYGTSARWAKWDIGGWDADQWGGSEAETLWRNATPQIMNMQMAWGADDPKGILTTCAAGSFSLITYDPDRLLDPSNPDAGILDPGTAIRVLYNTDRILRSGFIDEISYDPATKQGRISGSDAVSILVGAGLREGPDPSMPQTLRARARYLMAKAQLNIPIEDDWETDIQIGLWEEREVSLWSQLQVDALDALRFMWIDEQGVLRWRPFDFNVHSGVFIGGPDGIPVETIRVNSSLQGVFSRVIATFISGNEYEIQDADAMARYGDRFLRRQHPVPFADQWANAVIADRSHATLQYIPGTIRPVTSDQLSALATLAPCALIGLRATNIPPPAISLDVRLLGARFEANTESGWSCLLVTYITPTDWKAMGMAEVKPAEDN